MFQILVAEDNENNRLLIEDLLRKHRSIYQLQFVYDGKQLLEILQTQTPDLVLLDMRLPEVSGWEAAEQLKSNPQTAHIPLIAVTAHAMKGDREKALASGCDDFITKPVDKQTLLDSIQRWCSPEST